MTRTGALRRRVDFQKVHEKGATWMAYPLIIKALPNSTNTTRFGLSVSKSIGKAVVRNRLRRRLKEIIRQMPLKPGWDIIVIARPGDPLDDFWKLRAILERLLCKANLIEGHETAGTGTY
ncbi:MAG: ribonuclease P protein component [Dehalococcoidia bacterium]|nr:ribonuclease P protein component [Dehalococcoidia bacterium]